MGCTDCQDQQLNPNYTPPPCSDVESTCLGKMDAECVEYHLDNQAPSKLSNLGLSNKSDLSEILEKIDALLGNSFSFVLQKQDSNSVTITIQGPVIKADVNLSEQTGNLAQVLSDGLYVAQQDGKVQLSPTDVKDYLPNKLIGGTDSVTSISFAVVNGQLKATPILNITQLLTAIKNNASLSALFHTI